MNDPRSNDPVVQHDECLTLDDWRHAIRSHQGKIAHLEQQLRDARYLVGMLVHAAGGRVELTPATMIALDAKDSLTHWDDPITGSRIYALQRTTTT